AKNASQRLRASGVGSTRSWTAGGGGDSTRVFVAAVDGAFAASATAANVAWWRRHNMYRYPICRVIVHQMNLIDRRHIRAIRGCRLPTARSGAKSRQLVL